MRIGIIETGKVNDALMARYGDYPAMFERLLRDVDPALSFRTYATVDGEVPDDPGACDAWLITGSRHGVYDGLPWIEPLKAFLVAARNAGRPVVGVCFGHQILAEAFGGRAVKSDKGWGVGVHDYEVIRRPKWMSGAPDRIAAHAMHQDQVTAIPDDATVLATSPFCEYAMLAYGDPEAPYAISVQPHPEYTPGFAREIIELRARDLIPRDRSEPALRSLSRPANGREIARWFVDYLREAKLHSAAA